MRYRIIIILLMGSVGLLGCQPDLVVSLESNNQYAVGDEVKDTVKITVSNKGSGKALGTQDAGANGYMVDLILSTDKNVPVQFATLPNPYTFKEDMLLKGGRLSNTDTLAPGASRVYSVATPPPIAGLIPPGTPSKVYLCAVVDPGKKINESNENNNVDFRPISIAP